MAHLRTLALGPFVTEGGHRLPDVTVGFRTWGDPSAPAVVIGHALTGDTDAVSWWSGLVGPGKLVDPAHHFVICAGALGSCVGTTGPGTNAGGARLGSRFPRVTIRDQARLHLRLLDHLEVAKVALAAGGSMGGMQMLELALCDAEAGPDRVDRLLLIGMGAAHGAWQIGVSEAQRMAIRADPRWRGGDFPADDPPADGLASARAMAMMTYRSAALFADRFGRGTQDRDFAIASYLRYQGAKLVDRFDAGSYVALTEAMDTHDALRHRSVDTLARLRTPALCVGISSDVLYPPEESRDLADRLGHGRYALLDSPFGHDAFLVDFDALDALARPFFAETGFYSCPPHHASIPIQPTGVLAWTCS